jgi:hypothetical protein
MKRIQWNEALIASELMEVIKSIGKFPSNSILIGLGRCDLANQISKKGGFVSWAKRLGMDREESDSDFGWNGEEIFKKMCDSRGIECLLTRSTVKSPYDAILMGTLRVDVKSANFTQYGASMGWFYRIGKHLQSDVVALLQVDFQKVVFLPWWICPNSNVTISRDSGKYKNFYENWDLIIKMINVRKKEIEEINKFIL